MGTEEIYSSGTTKVVKVDIPAGERMPTHYATSEAFIIVNKGKAELILSNSEEMLTEGSTAVIPEGRPHTLNILEDFEAHIVLAGVATLEYANRAAESKMNKK